MTRPVVTLEVLAVLSSSGTVAVAYGALPDGREVAIAVEPRMANDLREAVRDGRRPLVDVESWQMLQGFPERRKVRR
jgi:hypothetical protein